MRHLHLTCKNHPLLLWTCKAIAFTPTDDGGRYNHSRHIFPQGEECSCPPDDLRLAPCDPWYGLTKVEQEEALAKEI